MPLEKGPDAQYPYLYSLADVQTLQSEIEELPFVAGAAVRVYQPPEGRRRLTVWMVVDWSAVAQRAKHLILAELYGRFTTPDTDWAVCVLPQSQRFPVVTEYRGLTVELQSAMELRDRIRAKMAVQYGAAQREKGGGE